VLADGDAGLLSAVDQPRPTFADLQFGEFNGQLFLAKESWQLLGILVVADEDQVISLVGMLPDQLQCCGQILESLSRPENFMESVRLTENVRENVRTLSCPRRS